MFSRVKITQQRAEFEAPVKVEIERADGFGLVAPTSARSHTETALSVPSKLPSTSGSSPPNMMN